MASRRQRDLWKQKKKEEPNSESLASLPKEELERIVSTQVAVQIQQLERYSGPLPHPKHVKEYEEVCPGCFDRILAMAEAEQRIQGSIAGRSQWFDFLLQASGLIIFFILSGGGIFGGFWLLYQGQDATGIAAILAGLAALIGSAWFRRKTENKQ